MDAPTKSDRSDYRENPGFVREKTPNVQENTVKNVKIKSSYFSNCVSNVTRIFMDFHGFSRNVFFHVFHGISRTNGFQSAFGVLNVHGFSWIFLDFHENSCDH